MKKLLAVIIVVLGLLISAIGLSACELSGGETKVTFKTLAVDGNNVYGKVSNDTTTFSFLNEIETNGKAKYTVSFDRNGNEVITSKDVDLEIGDNTFYILVTVDGDMQAFYEATVRRRPIYTVSFDTKYGTSIASQQVEEDGFATEPTIEPTTTRAGYTFIGWDYDFTVPVVDNLTVNVIWEIKEEMSNFNFTSDATTCRITSIKDTTVTEIIIPDYVTSIGQSAFSGCSNLTRINVSENNANYKSIDGNLYSKDGETLVRYATGKTATTFIIPDSVKSIGGWAFDGCTSLTSINIPDSVTSIGDYAFRNCSSLKSITIPDSVTSLGDRVFYGCSSLTSITIPDSVTSIRYAAFSGCSNLTSVTIGNSVTRIRDGAFYNCSKLTSITIPDSVTSIGNYAFRYCSSLTSVTIPDSVKSIGEGAFFGCESLTSITIPFVGETLNGTNNTHFGYIFGASRDSGNSTYVPSSLKTVVITGGDSIGDSAFDGCTSLTSINIPDSVTSIGDYAFRNCSSLISITIPNSVTHIGSRAFEWCSSLTSITIPDSVKSIGGWAFSGCSRLTNINVSENNANYKSIDGNLYSKDGETLIQYAIGKTTTTFIIPDSVTSIGGEAFYKCINLTSINIPDSVTIIGGSTFEYCSKLTSITIPDSVTSIGGEAFLGCNSLIYNVYDNGLYLGNTNNPYVVLIKAESQNVISCIINSNTKLIRNSAFYYCSSLTSVTIPDSVTSIGDYAFSYCTSLTSITFNGTKSQWQAISKGEYWKAGVPSSCKVHCTDGDISI